ncbi:MAG: hypothetical protein E7308_01030 [Butyrivibrio sp.]|nr:hypothetical protein [Butyrivibrio sp.]
MAKVAPASRSIPGDRGLFALADGVIPGGVGGALAGGTIPGGAGGALAGGSTPGDGDCLLWQAG